MTTFVTIWVYGHLTKATVLKPPHTSIRPTLTILIRSTDLATKYILSTYSHKPIVRVHKYLERAICPAIFSAGGTIEYQFVCIRNPLITKCI